ncbi:hypothetical protein [Streptomyces melanogenes]|uniref:Low molecular weight antigen MTB12-like C-terminal domain-containing protein n=1 Tax=Streptomyces melanogenes TaxID=67326 RepID=A0ABZ1XV50_9ACTN|nr:hypothetical protein [Streptomyces melanogenes]
MSPGTRVRPAAWAAAAVLVLFPAAAACSDSGGGSEKSPSPTATAPAAQPADPAAAKAQIEKNWTTFFDPEASTDAKVKVLENGEALRPLLAAFGNDKNAARSSAKVTDVTFGSPTQAAVTYDLLIGGNPALPGAKGTAVLQDQTWKVSVKTLCALVRLSGNAAAPGC